MSTVFEDMVQADYSDLYDEDYQGKVYLVEEALRELGQMEPAAFTASPYDDVLSKLIDAVPLE